MTLAIRQEMKTWKKLAAAFVGLVGLALAVLLCLVVYGMSEAMGPADPLPLGVVGDSMDSRTQRALDFVIDKSGAWLCVG